MKNRIIKNEVASIFIVLFCASLFINFKMKLWWFEPKMEVCWSVIKVEKNTNEQFQWDRTAWYVQMSWWVKTFVVNDFVKEWNEVCEDINYRRVKKDWFVKNNISYFFIK